MKKIFYTAFIICTISILNNMSIRAASEEPQRLLGKDLEILRGCKTVEFAERVFSCPLSIPGAYTINPEKIDAFLAECAPVSEFVVNQEAVVRAKSKEVDLEQLKLYEIVQIIAQSYFQGTGEKDYIYTFPFVKGNEARILDIASATGLLTLHNPLETYMQYGHVTAAIGNSRTLVFGCGRASLSNAMYHLHDIDWDLLNRTGFVSSGCYCAHTAHVTVSRAPGIFPTIVADIFNKDFQREFEATAKAVGGFEAIIDEEGIIVQLLNSVLPEEVADAKSHLGFFKSLLKPGGKFIAVDYYDVRIGDDTNRWKYF